MNISRILSAVAGFGLVLTCSLQAQGARENDPRVYEICELKDGSVLNGYTFSTLPDGRLIFHTENSIRVLPRDQASQRFDTKGTAKELSKMDGPWLEFKLRYPAVYTGYLNPNNAFNARGRVAASLDTMDPAGPTIYILPPSGDNFRYLSIAQTNDTLNVEDIRVIRRAAADPEARVGLLDYYVLNDGDTLVGVTTEDRLSNGVTLTMLDGLFQELAEDDYIVRGVARIDEDMSYVAQSPYISVFSFEDGTQVEGVMLVMDYDANTITIERVGGKEPVTRSLDNYRSRTTRRNESFPPDPPKPLDYSEGQVYVDKVLMAPVENVSKNDNPISISAEDLSQKAVNAPNPGNDRLLTFTFQAVVNDVAVGNPYLFDAADAREKNNSVKMKRDKLLTQAILPVGQGVGDDGISFVQFSAPGPGEYVLYFTGTDKAYIVHVN